MPTIIDSYSQTNQDSTILMDNSTFHKAIVAQSITGTGTNIASCQFYLSQTGGSGTLTAQLYAHSGTFGTSSVTTGSALATSGSINVSSLTGSLSLISFTFTGGNQITLTNATNYVLLCNASAASGVSIGTDTSSPTHGGNESDAPSAVPTTANAGTDVCFFLYQVDPPAPTISSNFYRKQGFQ